MNMQRALRQVKETREYRAFTDAVREQRYDKRVIEALSDTPQMRSVRRELRRLAFIETSASAFYYADPSEVSFRACVDAAREHDAAKALIIDSGLAAAVYGD